MNITKNSTKSDIIKALKDEGYEPPNKDATKAELLEVLGNVTGVDYSTRSEPEGKAVNGTPRETRTIIIPSGDTKLNQDDVFVGVNGVSYLIKRDVEAEVPLAVVEVLRNAKQTVGEQLDDGTVRYREVLTYPFSIVG